MLVETDLFFGPINMEDKLLKTEKHLQKTQGQKVVLHKTKSACDVYVDLCKAI